MDIIGVDGFFVDVANSFVEGNAAKNDDFLKIVVPHFVHPAFIGVPQHHHEPCTCITFRDPQTGHKVPARGPKYSQMGNIWL